MVVRDPFVAGGLGARIDRLRTNYWLRAVNRLGEGAVVEGKPFVRNEGSIVIGREFR